MLLQFKKYLYSKLYGSKQVLRKSVIEFLEKKELKLRLLKNYRET